MERTQAKRSRRRHSAAFKETIVAACREPGASVAGVALSNGLNANLVHTWLRQHGGAVPIGRQAARMDGSPLVGAPAFVPVPLPPTDGSGEIQIELRRGNTTMVIRWPVQAAEACGGWVRDWLR